MLGDYYYRKLPRTIQGRIESLLAELQSIAGPDLASVILHGSVARAEWVEGTSDIDLVVVLKKSARETLTKLGEALALARASARVDAMILVEREIARASDVFPLFYRDIREHHIVLFGSDPFASLAIDSKHLRLRIEQELRDVSIRLRRSVADARGEPRALGHAVARNLRRVRFPLDTLLGMLEDHKPEPAANAPAPRSLELRAVLERVGRKFDVDPVAFRRVHERPEAAYDALTLLLDRATDAVDRLEGR